jgi:hypothetical protein
MSANTVAFNDVSLSVITEYLTIMSKKLIGTLLTRQDASAVKYDMVSFLHGFNQLKSSVCFQQLS